MAIQRTYLDNGGYVDNDPENGSYTYTSPSGQSQTSQLGFAQQWNNAQAAGNGNAQTYANLFNNVATDSERRYLTAGGHAPTESAMATAHMPLYTGSAQGGGNASTGPAYTGPAQGGGTSNGQSSLSMTGGQNPYLRQMGDWLTQQMTNNFSRNVAPQISSGAMAAGGYGGSRQGVIEANANNNLQSQIGGALTNLYGQGYNTELQYDLGLRGNDLGYANLDRQINNDNLNWQMQGANFGLGLYDRMNNNYAGMYGVGNTIQNQPLNYWSQFSNAANSLGNGFNTGAQPASANPLMGAMGGMQAGQAFGNWWNNSPTANSFGGANSQGWGTGSGYGNQDYGQFL